MDDPDPYPLLATSRRLDPVPKSSPIGLDPSPRYNITRWEDVLTVLRDPETFSSSVCGLSLEPFTGWLLTAKDGAEHRQARNAVAKAFRVASIDRWEQQLMRPIIDELVDAVAARGRAELYSEVLSKYPVRVICGMYGVPLEDADEFHRWTEEITRGVHDPEPGFAASRALLEYLQPIVDQRRAAPGDDLLSDLLEAQREGGLSDEQLFGLLRLFLSAGTDTTELALGSMLVGVLGDRAAYERVVADPSLIPQVVEESLRWESPAPRTERLATRDVEVGGCPIPAGASMTVWLGSANRDETRFGDPDRLELDRERGLHLAFSTGPHQCLGMHLARRELQVGLEVLLERLPGLRLDPDAPAPSIEGALMRGPRALHVVWDPPAPPAPDAASACA